MINGYNFFDQPVVKHGIRTNDNTRKIATRCNDDYKTGYLLNCAYFKEN